MRSILIVGLALLFFSGLGLSAEYPDTSAPSHPDLIIVRRFAAPRRIVVLDPSLGFSLDRGRQGVPPADRAASVARATAFIVADTITQQLRDLGYDAVLSDEAGPETGGRALIISGVFRSINEGHRRHLAAKDASVVVSVDVDTQCHDEKPQRLKSFRLGFATDPAREREASRTRGQFGRDASCHHDRPCRCRAGAPGQLRRLLTAVSRQGVLPVAALCLSRHRRSNPMPARPVAVRHGEHLAEAYA